MDAWVAAQQEATSAYGYWGDHPDPTGYAVYRAAQDRADQAQDVLASELAHDVREARRRHEALGLTPEEVAFYDAIAGGSDDWVADPKLAEIARELVQSIKADLSVDWADHESTEAAIRTKIKHLLRRHGYELQAGSGRALARRDVVDLILDQARELYRFWPETYLHELPI
jgi:Type I restriction enzyme HindI endonuclease subunit-like, C-terminal